MFSGESSPYPLHQKSQPGRLPVTSRSPSDSEEESPLHSPSTKRFLSILKPDSSFQLSEPTEKLLQPNVMVNQTFYRDSHALLQKVRNSKNQATHYVLSKSSSPQFNLSPQLA